MEPKHLTAVRGLKRDLRVMWNKMDRSPSLALLQDRAGFANALVRATMRVGELTGMPNHGICRAAIRNVHSLIMEHDGWFGSYDKDYADEVKACLESNLAWLEQWAEIRIEFGERQVTGGEIRHMH